MIPIVAAADNNEWYQVICSSYGCCHSWVSARRWPSRKSRVVGRTVLYVPLCSVIALLYSLLKFPSLPSHVVLYE